jgi:lysophospholipase L1-like esterase
MLKKLALSLFALLFSLLAAELLIRLAGAAPKIYLIQKGRFQLSANPRIGYEPVPLAYQGKELSFYDYQGASNSQGYRDVDHARPKPAGVYRIVVLGDSIAAGLKIDRFEDTFPAQLQKILAAQGKKVEVLSLAVSGYNTQQEVETLKERGLAFSPDLVLLAYSLSSRGHIDGDILKTLLEEKRQKQGVDTTHANPWLVKSALYRFFRFRVFPPHQKEALPQQYWDLINRDTVAESMAELGPLAREHRFQVLVAVFPRFAADFARYPHHGKHQYARGQSEANGFAFLDLIEAYDQCRKAKPETPIEIDSFHPSVYGHQCAAQALAGKIVGELLPKG